MNDTVGQLSQTQIEDLATRYPLPEGVEDAVMTREELAHALDVSLPTITDWIKAGMPVQQSGGQGRAYELVLSHCWAWRQAWKAREDLRSEQVRRSQAAMRLALVGGKSGDSIEALDPKMRREIMAAQIEHERMARERNRLLHRDDVSDTFDQLLSLVRDTLESAPDKIERRQAVTPKAVNELIEICDDLVDELRRRIERFFATRPLKAEETSKRDLFDA